MKRLFPGIMIIGLVLLVLPVLPDVKAEPFIATDGGVIALSTASTNTITTTTFSTTGTNEIILVSATLFGNFAIRSITDSGGLSWIQRGFLHEQNSNNVRFFYEYYAVTTQILSSDSINVTALGIESFGIGVEALPISGASLTQPFDPGVGPQIINGTGTGAPFLSLTPVFTNTLVVSFINTNSSTAPTSNPPLGLASSSAQSTYSVGEATFQLSSGGRQMLSWNCGSSCDWDMIGDVVRSTGSKPVTGAQPQPPLQSVAGPGGYPVPKELGNSGVYNFILIFTAIVLGSSIQFNKREEKRRFEG